MRLPGPLIGLLTVSLSIQLAATAKEKIDQKCNTSETFADCSNLNLTTVPNYLPANITCLSLVGNKISELNGTVWTRYKSLQKLSLAKNKLKVIQNGDFDGLDNLTMLDLSLNHIRYTDISRYAFRKLKVLKYLDLKQSLNDTWDNETFPEALIYLVRLQSLIIDGVHSKPNFSLPTVTEFYISGQYGRCNISYLTRSYFERLPNVENLSLSDCNIQHVENCFLSPLTRLVSVDISGNIQLKLEAYSNITCGLQGSQTIKRLNLNSLYRPEKYAWCAYIGPNGSKYLQNTSLEMLTVEKNYLVKIRSLAIQYLPASLKYLSVSKNMFLYGKYFDYLINRNILRDLIYFDSSQMFKAHNDLSSSPCSFKTLRHNSSQGSCDSMFTRNTKKDYFELILERVHQYRTDRSPVDNQDSNIEYLDISSNLPYTYLMVLKLFKLAPNLKFLNLSNNYLGYPLLEGDVTFQDLKRLHTLDISNNRLMYLQFNVFSNLTGIEKLFLADNRIRNITFNLLPLKRLRYLDLRSNHIENIDKAVRDLLHTNKQIRIDLSNNPLKCSCKNVEFVKWLQSELERKLIISPYQTYCRFDNNTESRISTLKYNNFYAECSPPEYFIVILVVSIGLLMFLLVLCGGIMYRFRWNLRYLYYMTKLKMVGYQPIDSADYEKDVFVSYANEDRSFVCQKLLQELEEKGHLSLLLHERDFQAGQYIADNILRAVTTTRWTLVVLTKEYLKSKWCMYELNMARLEAADTGRNVLCVILKEDVPYKHLPMEVLDIVKKKTYLEFPENEQFEESFWDRLRSTLIHTA